MANKAHKIFTHCARCNETSEDTFTKSEVSKDISNLLMYNRMITTTLKQQKLITDRKDRLTDDKKKQVDQMKNDISIMYAYIEEIYDKYYEE